MRALLIRLLAGRSSVVMNCRVRGEVETLGRRSVIANVHVTG